MIPVMLRRRPHAAMVFVLLSAAAAYAQELPSGTIIDRVVSTTDPAESYALYLPSTYTPQRPWNVLMGFHPAARGRAMVEIYQAAAEQYGYIVAGSNTSRNGPWDVSLKAVQAMSEDLGRRFAIDAARVYLTGMSGGARVALQVALDTKAVAGVIASSAGFPDSRPRASVSFPLFGTAGTDDFNYVELRMLDRALSSPHRLAIFSGGHTLPPAAVAMDAIEWMELQAITSGKRSRDEGFIDRQLEKRRQVVQSASGTARFHHLQDLVADFKGLRDVSNHEAEASQLAKQNDIKKALSRERSDDDVEMRALNEVFDLEARLQDPDRRFAALSRLSGRLAEWARAAGQPAESPERSRARRSLGAIRTGAAGRVRDAEYLKILQQTR
jgi:poly(3-hydroxybutyrate) depolymerase